MRRFRLPGFKSSGAKRSEAESARIEARFRDAEQSVRSWEKVVRDMESDGLTADPRYDQYVLALARAREHVKRAELDLFNLRLHERGE